MCLDENCVSPFTCAGSNTAWLAHMRTDHLKQQWSCWCCPPSTGSVRLFTSPDLLEAHLTGAHSQTITTTQIPTIIKRSQIPPGDIFQGYCAFCGGLPEELGQAFADRHVQEAIDALEKHVRDHLFAFALLFLPVSLDECEARFGDDAHSSAENGANSAASSKGSVVMPVSHCGREGCDCYDIGTGEAGAMADSDAMELLAHTRPSTPPVSPPTSEGECPVCENTSPKNFWFCGVCKLVYCDGCWEMQSNHKMKSKHFASTPHEKTPLDIAEKVGKVLEPTENILQRERLHREDENTAWLGTSFLCHCLTYVQVI